MANGLQFKKIGLGFLSLAIMATACQPHHTVIVKPKNHRFKRELVDVKEGKLTDEMTDADYLLAPDMATLSAYVYAGKKPKGQRPDYAEDSAKYRRERQVLAAHNWEPFAYNYELKLPSGKTVMEGGLVYDVWVQPKAQPRPLAVLVFRGTDDNADWGSNIPPSWRIKSHWNQFEQTRALTPAIISQLEAAYGPKLRIFSAGHSLGGGLAQHALYTATRIEKAFVFNSSPLTGFYDFPSEALPRVENGRRIYRIYESNEVLAMLRFFTGAYRNRPAASDIVLVRYNFSAPLAGTALIHQHGIQLLAANLRGDNPQNRQ